MKSRTLITFALLGFTACLAQDVMTNITSNCTGYYYEDINAAFVDCFDNSGVLVSRQEEFYTSPLEKECNTTMFGDLATLLNKTASDLGVTIEDSDDVEFCDYYAVGEGYKFTLYQSGIGLFYVDSLAEGARALYYKNLTPEEGVLLWKWAELDVLIKKYAASTCPASGSGSSSESDSDYMKLNIDWSAWNSTAIDLNIADFDSWAVADFKTWLEHYVEFHNLEGEFNANLTANASISGGNVTVNITSNFTKIDFEELWSSDFDSMDLSEILLRLAEKNATIVEDFKAWFEKFFGETGIFRATVIVSSGSAQDFDIPVGMEEIVAWITEHVRIELEKPCHDCGKNETNGTVVPPVVGQPEENNTESNTTDMGNSTTNVTVNVTIDISFITPENATLYFSVENYTIPEMCNLTENSTEVCCVEDQKKVCYRMDQLVKFWTNSLSSTLNDVYTTYQAAGGDQEFRMNLYNKFQLAGTQEIYGWLYFDKLWFGQFVAEGAKMVNGWSLTTETCHPGFEFNFGDLTAH